MNILVLRAEDAARRTAARLSAAGYQPIISPVIAISPLRADLSGCFDAIIATSAHAFTEQVFSDLLSSPSLARACVYVVGQRTADRARKAGFSAIASVAEDAAGLAAHLLNGKKNSNALYLAGRDRKPDLELALESFCRLSVAETYMAQTVPAFTPQAHNMIRQGMFAGALHFSRRSAAQFCALTETESLQRQAASVLHIAISADAAEPLREKGWPVKIAARASEEAVLAVLDPDG